MPSNSFIRWTAYRQTALEQIETAHRTVGGTGRGRRFTTEQINHAYAMLLSSQFQGFCRDLHDECAARIATSIPHAALGAALHSVYLLNRKLDTGNPNPGNIGADFGRFGLAFWDAVRNLDIRNDARRAHLEELNLWRNAIAHQHFVPGILGGTSLRLQRVKTWRQACRQLAAAFDEVMRNYLHTLVGASPW